MENTQAIAKQIAQELTVQAAQVNAAIRLLDDGSTVPFISRYRKELTGGLDDLQLRDLESRLVYLRELGERRQSILNSIEEQGKLTPELKKQIATVASKTELEDIYLPYKPKRRSKALVAREAGLEPLADTLLDNPSQDPEVVATTYINPDKGVATSKDALDGAKQILMERFSENSGLIAKLKQYLLSHGVLCSTLIEEKKQGAEKYQDYFDYEERLEKIPSHRALAVFRGRKEGFLTLSLSIAGQREGEVSQCETRVADYFSIRNKGRLADKWLAEVVHWTWRIKLLMHLETDLLGQLRDRAQDEAIRVFAANLKAILLAPPAGNKVTIGLDPGLRTGVKVSAVDHTGKYLADCAIFPHAPRNQWDESIDVLAKLAKQHGAQLISIGNGTASRETDKLVADLIKRHPELKLQKVMVSEAGASVYSASDEARKEFPNLDVTVRGAISIARRLQDPLAELVKTEPKAIGVGQYQHDVSQVKLGQALDAVVEDCVNAVGVDVNMASEPLLRRVSGVSAGLAANIVEFRNKNGEFKTRESLKSVPRFGDKGFEQAAGFLRIVNGDQPLDASSVHPESYPLVNKIAKAHCRKIGELIGDQAFLAKIKPQDFIDTKFGLPTVTDILAELEKPGRDPRPEFTSVEFKDGVNEMRDLKPGMRLQGVVTNVTNFGAFVDVGVHQDGLVHISALSTGFVKDPHAVVKTGDVVKVKVMEIDERRKRISLTMRLDDPVKSDGATSTLAKSNTAKSNKMKSTPAISTPAKSTTAKSTPAKSTPTMGSLFPKQS